MNTQTPEYRIHHGRNVKRLREMLGIKQEAIAVALDLTQQAMSKLEQKEIIEDDQLETIASVLHVPVEAIKNMNDEAAANYINSFTNNDKVDFHHYDHDHYAHCSFNPIDKIIELYERMLKIEREKIEILQKKFDEKQGS